MLVFITQEANIPRIEACSMAQDFLAKLAKTNLGVEIIGV